MSIFITVIVPIYNIEKYLRRCLDSILNQTYRNFELILVDDGSTDSSGAIADEYGRKDDRITVLHKANGGSSSARNEALKIAKGEYISFIDSDDYIESDFLQTLSAPINKAKEEERPAPEFVQVGRNEIDEDGKLRPDICIPAKEEVCIDSKDFIFELLMHRGDCSFCTKLSARKLFEKRNFPIGKLNEDFHIMIQMLFEGSKVVSLPGYKYHVFYRIGSNSRKENKNNFSAVFKDSVDNADMVEEIVGEKMPELKEVARRFALFQRIEYLLHIPISCMRRDYEGYPECVSYIRKHFASGMTNRYLTLKNKIYIVIFAVAPKFARVIHSKIKGL